MLYLSSFLAHKNQERMIILKKTLINLICIFMLLPFACSAMTIYAPDGRTADVNESDVEQWKSVGWYDYPVTTMCALDGRTAIISSDQVAAWKNVGWYESVEIMYAPDGRTAEVAYYDIPAWQNVGWYRYPVTTMYAPDGRSAIVAGSDLAAWKNVGWLDQPITAENWGYGQVKGVVTWKYNKFIGTRGDDGAEIMLIPINPNVKYYDNRRAAMFLSSAKFDSGILLTEADGYGNYDFGNLVPAGDYIILIKSHNTTSSERFKDEATWESYLKFRVGDYFSATDFETLKIFIGYDSYSCSRITVKNGHVITKSYDFGYTYI